MPWSREQADSFRDYDRKVMESYTPEYHIIERQREASGRIAWLETNKVPLHDAKGNVTGILGTYEDITERIRAEQALLESEEKFRALAESARAGIVLFRDDKFIYVNPQTIKDLGYTQDELLAMNFWDVVHPDSRELVRSRGLERLQGLTVPSTYEKKVLTKGGETLWEELSAALIDYMGQPTVIATVFNITERKRAP